MVSVLDEPDKLKGKFLCKATNLGNGIWEHLKWKLVRKLLSIISHWFIISTFCAQPLPKSKKTPSKGSKKERNSSGTARKAKRTKHPEILSDESSSDEDEKKSKEESSEDEDKESEEAPPKKTSKKEKPKQKAAAKSKKSVKSANVKKADSSTTKKNQNSSKKESESEDSSDEEPLVRKLQKPPTDEELKETIKKWLANANLEEVTMKQICKEVCESHPAYDLTERKDFIKTTDKELISWDEIEEEAADVFPSIWRSDLYHYTSKENVTPFLNPC